MDKVGTNIIDNQCSWYVNKYCARARYPGQRKVLCKDYGRNDAVKDARIEALYEELGIREKYSAYEERHV